MPSSLRLLLTIACLALLATGGAWLLATFPPEQSEIVRPLDDDTIRNPRPAN
jgi:hypothetical protein